MAQSFLEVARELIDSPEAKAAYADDPDGFLAARDLGGLSAADLEDAVGFVVEAVPAPVARQMAPSPGPAADPTPLARLATATAVEAAVVDTEPGTVDLTALVDPSGQFDLPPVGAGEDGAPIAQHEAEEEEEEGEELPLDAADTDADEPADDAFGTGADDEDEDDEHAQEPEDEDEADDGLLPREQPGLAGTEHGPETELEASDASPTRPVEPPEEPHEDEFEEMI